MTIYKTGTREELAHGAPAVAGRGEGTHAAQRRAGAAASGTAVGARRERLLFRDRWESSTLTELFRGRTQLIVYHFMFGPDYKAGCPSCSAIADGFNGIAVHLASHDVMLWAVSRAPLAKLQAFEQRMGWSFPWASSFGSDFNYDYAVAFTDDQRCDGIEYNFRRQAAPAADRLSGKTAPAGVVAVAAMAGVDVPTYAREAPGISTFARDGDDVYHTYSAYARGVDGLWNMYQWLDRAPEGRNESGPWVRHHDKY